MVQLPKRSAPDLTATEDEYRDWSDEDESTSPVDGAPQVRTSRLSVQTELVHCLYCFPQATSFPQVAAAVQVAIAALGGAVVPKLNWSCPKVLCCST